jgi:hypothetical protein
LHWQSQPNAIYQVQYVSDLSGLVDNGVGWQTLVNNYPSQGTNTLWLDTGDCLQTPPVNHPKFDEARFYQVVCLGTNPAMPFGPPPQQQIQGGVTNQPSAFIPQAPACATRFGARMQQGGWKEGFNYPGAQVTLNNLRSAALGGNEIFGNVTVGFFIGHGFFRHANLFSCRRLVERDERHPRECQRSHERKHHLFRHTSPFLKTTILILIHCVWAFCLFRADAQTNDCEVFWRANTNDWPSSLWVYKAVPQVFAPPVISNLVAMAGFTMADKDGQARRRRVGLFLSDRDGRDEQQQAGQPGLDCHQIHVVIYVSDE